LTQSESNYEITNYTKKLYNMTFFEK